jgi:hypothetical protein
MAVLERARALAAVRQPPTEPPEPRGPTREELLQVLEAERRSETGRQVPV